MIISGIAGDANSLHPPTKWMQAGAPNASIVLRLLQCFFMYKPKASGRKAPIQPAELQTTTTKVYTYRI
ncbi:hypothetical protein I2I11_14450 [Pontibacter sp. 172403-2]|uniref:hypothetical protein n=1 Tax=Pontibacter rufus TaxID=2791028 RepID=UPI0018AF6315|nr:hypothetical protein [Pontibacter sp. 172403-2]MBF9254501.1 hypothetical protein [Pontibacter sp. 172403-2]